MSESAAGASRRRVHGLIEAMQDVGHEYVREQLDEIAQAAQQCGDADLAQLTAAAVLLHELLHHDDVSRLGPACDHLVRSAEDLGSAAALAMALSLRAMLANAAPAKQGLIADSGLAVALVEQEDCSAYERCFVWTTLSCVYISLNLWELADELNERAATHAHECEEPERQLTAVATNRFLIQLAWAAGLLEHGDEEQAIEHLVLAERAAGIPIDTLAATTPILWLHEARATRALLSFVLQAPLVSEEKADALLAQLDEHRHHLTASLDGEALPYLDGFAAYGLLRTGRVARAREYVVSRPATTSTAAARAFQAWIHARVLTPEQPDEATAAQRDYGRVVCELRWDARLGVLAAARTRIDEARLATEHAILSREVVSDALTGLSNRRRFDQWLLADPERPLPAALVLVDVDDFKQVNDLHGHTVGDEVLRRIGAAIRASVREDDVAVRLGGDEFAVILTPPERWGDHAEDTAAFEEIAAQRARAVADAVAAAPWGEVSPGLSVTVTVGHAVGRSGVRHGGGAQLLYRRADEHLYAAKRARPVRLTVA